MRYTLLKNGIVSELSKMSKRKVSINDYIFKTVKVLRIASKSSYKHTNFKNLKILYFDAN